MIHVAVNKTFTGKISDTRYKRRYNDTFEDMELATQRDLAIWVWRGHPFCAQHRHVRHSYVSKRTGETKETTFRHGKNFSGSNVLALDFDEESYKSSFPGLLADPFVQQYGGFLYSTQSSTPESPRSRLVFELDRYIDHPELYQTYLEALMHRFATKDRSCSDPCRIFAGSKNCAVELLGNVLPVEALNGLLDIYQGYLRRLVEDRRSQFEKDIDSRVPEERLSSALATIPLWKTADGWNLDYSDWRRIIAAIHSWDAGPAGYRIAVNWSGHDQADEIESMFESFDRHHGSMANVETIFYLARSRGWCDTMKFESHDEFAEYQLRRAMRRYG